jgi:hypothetical protein
MRASAFSNGVRRSATVLWGVGAGLAATTGVLAVAHSKFGYGFIYSAVAVALGTLAVVTRRGNRRAEVVTLVLLGSQLIGAAGAAWELAYGADDTAKARHLHDLGINYRLALVGNLAFSTLASAVFVWAMVRLVRARRHRGP